MVAPKKFVATALAAQPPITFTFWAAVHQQQRHHLIAKIPRSRRWRASRNGRRVMAAAVKLREVASPRF